MKKFPGTKTEFDTWWGDKEDTSRARLTSCPIARFIRHKGIDNPHVTSASWYDNPYSLARYPLPVWAKRYVREFDESWTWKGNK